jgi:hypothetical protein
MHSTYYYRCHSTRPGIILPFFMFVIFVSKSTLEIKITDLRIRWLFYVLFLCHYFELLRWYFSEKSAEVTIIFVSNIRGLCGGRYEPKFNFFGNVCCRKQSKNVFFSLVFTYICRLFQFFPISHHCISLRVDVKDEIVEDEEMTLLHVIP